MLKAEMPPEGLYAEGFAASFKVNVINLTRQQTPGQVCDGISRLG